MIVRIPLAAILLAFACSAMADNCVADTPAATARWVHDHDRDLDPPKPRVRRALSGALYALLKKEHECVVRTREVCALDADLWTETQDGRIVGPIAFETSRQSETEATVRMNYKFSLDDDGRDAKAWSSTIRLARKTASSCWAVDDITSPDGTSLKALLRQNK